MRLPVESEIPTSEGADSGSSFAARRGVQQGSGIPRETVLGLERRVGRGGIVAADRLHARHGVRRIFHAFPNRTGYGISGGRMVSPYSPLCGVWGGTRAGGMAVRRRSLAERYLRRHGHFRKREQDASDSPVLVPQGFRALVEKVLEHQGTMPHLR